MLDLPSPGWYARNWQRLTKLDPATPVRVPGAMVGMAGWGDQVATAGEVRASCMAALQNRINARGGVVVREAREGDAALARDAARVRDIRVRRVRVYQFETRAARARFSHLLARYDD